MPDTHPNIVPMYETGRTSTARSDSIKEGSTAKDKGDGLNGIDQVIQPVFALDATDEATMITFWRAHANEVFEWQPEWESSAQLYRFRSAQVTYTDKINLWRARYEKRHS